MNWKQIIWNELRIWQTAYPSQRKLLENFATKIKLEIELQGGEKSIPSKVLSLEVENK